MAQVLEPAIELALDGFPVSPVIAGYWAKTEQSFRPWKDSQETFLLDGKRAPKTGDLFRNSRLAESYRNIAENGPDHFYRGPIAKQSVDFS
jgi:gamma-glutamyltranspeptidase/glutathione hydrolase